MTWERLIEGHSNIEDIKVRVEKNIEKFRVYPKSIQKKGNTLFFIIKEALEKLLIIAGSDEYFKGFDGNEDKVNGVCVKVCKLTHENCVQLRELFPYTRPVSHGNRPFSFGLGDRLGIASAGHIRLIQDMDVFPILAQQSIRELNLTGRTYSGVLDDASWAVFQEGYTKGFGADADHLKTKQEVQMGIDCGYSMITLDCSEHIANEYFNMSEEQISQEYAKLPETLRQETESLYLSGGIRINDTTMIRFNKSKLMKYVLVYRHALGFIQAIYEEAILESPRKIDFEISVDETIVPTTPEAHFYIANQLRMMNIQVDNLAPRFCGEFQKGIDYIGDVREFEYDFTMHERIAEYFGYRLSIHSGSDKFSVFSIIGKYTYLHVHVKTAGTNWLEAVRLIAEKSPSLYRRMHRFAIEHLNEARKYYHIGAKPENIADIDTMDDSNLPALMSLNDSRQVLHITYGLLLQAKNRDGRYTFRDDIYRVLNEYENDYYGNLAKHIGKHLELLGVAK